MILNRENKQTLKGSEIVSCPGKLFRFIILLLLCHSLQVKSQEQLRPLTTNAEVISRNAGKKIRLKSIPLPDTIKSLPFIDDFSSSSIFPDQRKWMDKKAYINSTYPINPPSIGVATLDAINEYGFIYPTASSRPSYADELTSKPIKIDPALKNVWLSFYYEPGGIGDMPDSTDLLEVDFYNPDMKEWVAVFDTTPGKSNSIFHQKMIEVTSEYYKRGVFQFRFRNMVTIDGSDVTGRHGNADMWHIDYVRLNANRSASDTVLRDVAVQKPQTSLLKTYYSMPWEQFKKAFQTIIKPTISIDVINNHPDSTKLAQSPTFEFREIAEANPFYMKIDGPGTNIPPSGTFSITTDLTNPFQPNNTSNKEVKFEVKSFISTNTSDNHENDTTRFIQIFSNYFAYDDGSAEAGYGVSGQGTQNARVAYAFTAYKADTLSGISFYFNPLSADTSFGFRIAVWTDNKGKPGNLLYIQGEKSIPKERPVNQMYTFALDSGILVSGKFYIGWVQVTEDFLNIGMDLNNNNQDKLFINLSGIWENSEIKGTLMMRPIFRNAKEGFQTGVKEITKGTFRIFPNPAQNLVNIQTETNFRNLHIQIFTISGKLVFSEYTNQPVLNVGNLPDGLYIMNISSENTTFAPVKLMIQR